MLLSAAGAANVKVDIDKTAEKGLQTYRYNFWLEIHKFNIKYVFFCDYNNIMVCKTTRVTRYCPHNRITENK